MTNKLIKPRFLIILGFAVGSLVVAYSALVFAFLESSDIHPHRPIGFAIIPKVIRQIEPAAQCAPSRFIRRYQECGGICGEYVGLKFGSTQTNDIVQTYQLETIKRISNFKSYFVSINDKPPVGTAECPTIVIEFYNEWGTN